MNGTEDDVLWEKDNEENSPSINERVKHSLFSDVFVTFVYSSTQL